MAFPKTIVDREMLGNALRRQLPGWHIVVGARGCKFISIERERTDRPQPMLMWDGGDFDPPAILSPVPHGPGVTFAGRVTHTVGEVPCIGPNWLSRATNKLAFVAMAHLADERTA